jgi:hypothetical protein
MNTSFTVDRVCRATDTRLVCLQEIDIGCRIGMSHKVEQLVDLVTFAADLARRKVQLVEAHFDDFATTCAVPDFGNRMIVDIAETKTPITQMVHADSEVAIGVENTSEEVINTLGIITNRNTF